MGTLTDIDAGADTRGDLGRLLTHLEQKLAELERLEHDLAEDAQALARAVSSAGAPSSNVGVLDP